MQCRHTEKHKASLMERHVDRGVMVPVGQQVIVKAATEKTFRQKALGKHLKRGRQFTG